MRQSSGWLRIIRSFLGYRILEKETSVKYPTSYLMNRRQDNYLCTVVTYFIAFKIFSTTSYFIISWNKSAEISVWAVFFQAQLLYKLKNRRSKWRHQHCVLCWSSKAHNYWWPASNLLGVISRIRAQNSCWKRPLIQSEPGNSLHVTPHVIKCSGYGVAKLARGLRVV